MGSPWIVREEREEWKKYLEKAELLLKQRPKSVPSAEVFFIYIYY